MKSIFFVVLSIYLIQNTYAEGRLCSNTSIINTRSCSSQILNQEDAVSESCKVHYFPPNSDVCKDMDFGPIVSNEQIGGVKLKPYMIKHEYQDDQYSFSDNYTVLNITFTNIRWKTMKFRFQRQKDGNLKNHCRNIVLENNVTLNDQSVLYYDCYWSVSDKSPDQITGHNHILDFEAIDEYQVVNRGQYYFNVPSPASLDPNLSIEEWKPFIYIDISSMTLHIAPPPTNFDLKAYQIQIHKECETNRPCWQVVKNKTVKFDSLTDEVVFYEDSLMKTPGSYFFSVTPLHTGCINNPDDCTKVMSPKVTIKNYTLNICIASVAALIVGCLFAYYVVLRFIRKYWCKDYRGNEIPTPPQILVIYSPTNKLHAECVTSFVTYLRSEYCFDVMYDGDISMTSHGDPYIWAEESFKTATHVIYIAGPVDGNIQYNNIYDQPIINVHKNVDTLQLAFLKVNRATKYPKDVVNVFFEHSVNVPPNETKYGKSFYLLKDWQKLISYLSKNVVPRQLMSRTDRGKCLLDDLNRAKKQLKGSDSVVIKCEKIKFGLFDKKSAI